MPVREDQQQQTMRASLAPSLATVVELGLTSGVAPVGGIVVTVALFAVSMAAVFRTDQISFLEGRAAKPIGDA